MALTAFQRTVARLLADHRIAAGESYVAGGAALNELLAADRVSRDLDLFHDTEAAVTAMWDADRRVLEGHGFTVAVLRERPSFVEAEVTCGADTVRVEWTRDSAFRFFPLVRHEVFGLALHPFDLATNKVLALVGRLEPRDWIDAIACDQRLQPLGFLAWAASGKDPGFSPAAILEQASRSGRYSAVEIASLAFDGDAPDAADLSQRWHAILAAAREVVDALPGDHVGRAVLAADLQLFTGTAGQVRAALSQGRLRFHAGRLKGAFPNVSPP
jgi:hypothetical protein